MKDRGRHLFLALVLLTGLPLAAHAQSGTTAASETTENRTALVIGNASYANSPLVNPVNDARAVAKVLNEAGFQVKLRVNLTQAQMRQAVREFGDELYARRGVGLFYFAGHGVQIQNRNFLIPVGADIRREYEVADQAVDAASVLAMMEGARARVNIVILDACRNNPFARDFRSTINGLAPMQAPAGSLIAFATAPGQTASDGAGRNGLYTENLVESMALPGLKIEDVFKRVRVGVQRTSGGKQIPWENTSLTGDFYFMGGATADGVAGQAQQEAINQAVKAALLQRERDEAARRQRLRDEIQQEVMAALSKLEQGQASAQAGKVTKEAEDTKTSIARLKQELAELQAEKDATEKGQATQVALAKVPARPKPIFAVGSRVERPEVRSGDHWSYTVTDRYTDLKSKVYVEVATVTESRIYTRSSQESGSLGNLSRSAGIVDVWDRDWNRVREGEIEYAPFFPFAKFPLDAGSTWSGKVTVDGGGRSTMTQDVTARVVGWERVTVPAGTFDVVRIDLRGDFNLGAGRSGSIIDTYWYAPAARQFVKKDIDHRSLSPSRMSSSMVLTAVQRYERWELTEFRTD